jgi:hypothetical protein
MNIVVVGHRSLIYSLTSLPIDSCTICSVQDESLWEPQNNKRKEEGRMYMGLTNTIGKTWDAQGGAPTRYKESIHFIIPLRTKYFVN